MNKPKFGYGWLIKWILAAILIAAGILIRIYDDQVVYATTGIAIVIFSLLRVVPLLKTLKKEVLRTINLIEIIFDTIIGGLMIYVVFSGNSGDAFWIGLYGYLLAVFFYARGFIYFTSLYFFGEKTEPLKFWFHIIALTLGAALAVLALLNKDIMTTLGWIVLFIAVAGGCYLGYDGYGGYRIYREKSKALNEEKQKAEAEKQPILDKPVEQPKVEEPKENEVPIS
jgi:hypothetical protein